jgi:hemin uptake protein HemP
MTLKSCIEGATLSEGTQNEEPTAEHSPLPLRREEKRKIWRSEDLLGSECEAVIVHRGQEYRLRCTRQGKLILFK